MDISTTLQPHEERLIEEYKQVRDRITKLDVMVDNWQRLDFNPECTKAQLIAQLKAMRAYKKAIERRNDFKRIKKLVN